MVVSPDLEALLSRERYYRCSDYLSVTAVREQQRTKKGRLQSNGNKPVTTSSSSIPGLPSEALLSMLEECASLVTDTNDWTTEAEANSITTDVAPMPRSPSAVSAISTQDESLENQTKSGDTRTNAVSIAQNFVFWRQQMCQWAFAVVRSFDIETEAVAIAFNLLDRYVVHELGVPGAPSITREDFQLFAMTALYVAVKAFIPYPRKLGADALVAMSREFYSCGDIVQTERDMLCALGWRINTPTVYTFCSKFLKSMELDIMEKKPAVERICVEISERIVADPFFVPLQASLVGLACLFYALRSVGGQEQEAQQQFLPQIALSVGDQSSEATFAAVVERLDTLAVCT